MDKLELDLHTHLLPGVDDGSRSEAETVAMAAGLVSLGVRQLHLTPHQFRLGCHSCAAEIERGAERVRACLLASQIDVVVRAGAEYAWGDEFLDAVVEGRDLVAPLVDGQRLLLVEFPSRQHVAGTRELARLLRERGMQPVLAHPERIACVGGDIGRLLRWIDEGWHMQLDLMSLTGRHGPAARDMAEIMLAEGLDAFVGSDIHRFSDLETVKEAHATYRRLVSREATA